MAADPTREDLPRISVESIQDWKRVKANYRSAALSQFDLVLESSSSKAQSERDAILAHLNKFIEDTFEIARPNLRINGRNFEDFNEDEREVEPFDEALDRHIWSLDDQIVRSNKDLADKRRSIPQKVESMIKETHTMADEALADTEDTAMEDIVEDDPLEAKYPEIEEVLLTIAAQAKELSQVIPLQHERSERVKTVSHEVKALKP
ncbi:hypothetical protein PLICRDRAFT_639208 [Plicaturopsis crispa FD-325 SS-3]|nr:hypothetical protein PLICRDRAFT_639208 [Plicaturopsis crispa FD-325 SS-3]